MQNRRKHVRRTVRHRASIWLADNQKLTGVVDNIADGGACLLLDTASELPATFFVSIPGERIERSCRLVWRRGLQIGVEFD